MEFQCLSWHAEDYDPDEDDPEALLQYKIYMFGKTETGESVCAKVDFNPYFFIECPRSWTEIHLTMLKNVLRQKLGKRDGSGSGGTDPKDELWRYVKSAEFVERKKFFGFTNGETFRFVRLGFSCKKAFTRASYVFSRRFMASGLGNLNVAVYEANIDPMLRFCHVQEIQPAGWVAIDRYSQSRHRETRCHHEIVAKSWRDARGIRRESIAPFVQASFDIETYSYDGSFPDPEDERCPCIQIATTLQRFGEPEPYRRHLINLGTMDDIDGVDCVTCDTEQDVLEAWADLVRQEDVDVLIGYNIWGFDLHYMFTRARRCKADGFFELGRFSGRLSQCKAASFSSGAYGDSDYKMVDTLGRLQIDLLVVMKREHKLSSYSLNSVSEHFLGDKKVDMPYKEMFKKYKGTSADRREIGVYCVKDTDLPLKLVNKLAILPNMIEMAKATWVPASFLIERGQGIKVFSQIVYMTRRHDMLVVTLRKPKTPDEPYEGATVLGAKAGAYMENPITGLDFASLYPTIMRAHNLCHSTLVIDAKYDNVPGVTYKEVDGHRFVQEPEGILPMMLRTLAANRKQAKRDMADAARRGDYFMKSVYNGKQLAFKVSMNSIYGFCGATVGMLPCKPVAACTTSIGRQMIEQTKTLVEKWYPGADVVYGDSVSGDTPILIRDSGESSTARYVEISTLFGKSAPPLTDVGKCYAEVQGIDVFTDDGWTPVTRAMRHALEPRKRMFRVHTHMGIVDVTEDHSLLNIFGSELTPSDSLGKELMAAWPEDVSKWHKFYVDTHPLHVTKTRSKLYAAMAYGQFRAERCRPSVCVKDGMYVVSSRAEKPPTPLVTVLETIDRPAFVYDLTTENHHFHAGVGELIVHNTDSVMVKFNTGELKGKDALRRSFELGEEAAGRISATFKKPIELEFEKVYYPYLLFSKKRYAGLMYTNPEKPDYIDAKGIQVVRRDNCKFVRDVSQQVLDTIMYKLDTVAAMEIAKTAARTLLSNRVQIPDLVVSKSIRRIGYWKTKIEIPPGKKYIKGKGLYLTHEYANPKLPHITVAIKREERAPGSGPKSGDRVPYVFVDTGNSRDLQFQKAEDPEYAIQNSLTPDVEYYMEHGLRSPIESLFSVFVERPYDHLFRDIVQEFKTRSNVQIDLYEFLGL